jgi:hypothetical protein
VDFQVDRAELHTSRFVEGPTVALDEGEVRLRVDAFALTSNTITYGVVGDQLGYWEAFPVAGDGIDGGGDEARTWGRIPAWGVAEVVESRSDLVPLGVRTYGFVPMSSELVVTPGKVGASGFSDVSGHRSRLAAVYNRYRTLSDTGGPIPSADEVRRMVHEPLFLTSFLIEDLLSEQDDLDHLIISSASSKTAIGTAFRARARGGAQVVGLTSPGNRSFVEDLGIYDHVLAYDELDALPDGHAAYVDIAGAQQTRADVHERYGAALRTSLIVGQTHWDEVGDGSGQGLPGPAPTFFFAPTRIAERAAEWGRATLDAEVAAAWQAYVDFTDDWVRYDHAVGPTEVEATYRALLDNRADPSLAATRSL